MKKLSLILGVMLLTVSTFAQPDSNQIKPITIEANTLESVTPEAGDSTQNNEIKAGENQPVFSGDVEPTKSGLPHIFYIPSGDWFLSGNYFDYMHSAVPSGVYKDDQVPVLRNEDNGWSNTPNTNKIDVKIGAMKKVKILEDTYYHGKGERSKYNPGVSFPFCYYIAPGFNLPTFPLSKGLKVTENYIPNEDGTGFNYSMPANIFDKEIKEAIKKAIEDAE